MGSLILPIALTLIKATVVLSKFESEESFVILCFVEYGDILNGFHYITFNHIFCYSHISTLVDLITINFCVYSILNTTPCSTALFLNIPIQLNCASKIKLFNSILVKFNYLVEATQPNTTFNVIYSEKYVFTMNRTHHEL